MTLGLPPSSFSGEDRPIISPKEEPVLLTKNTIIADSDPFNIVHLMHCKPEIIQQILENQEIVNQLQYQGFSDLKTWLTEIEVMREKADKYDALSEDNKICMHCEENKHLKDILSKIEKWILWCSPEMTTTMIHAYKEILGDKDAL